MQMLPVILAFLLGSPALAYVLYPIYRHIPFDPTQAAHLNISVNAQSEREQHARTALQEVELDYQLGNLGESDYRSIRRRYMRRAVLAMKTRREREQELDAMIEEKLRLLKEVERRVDE
jgi:hypothetical protein